MRTIKFRGHENGNWHIGDLEYNPSKKIARIHSYNENGEYVGRHIVDIDTVGEFTGIKDKNGKEVYEGDLLRFPAKNEYEQIHYAVYEVFWHDNDCAAYHIGWQMNRLHYQGSLCGIDTGMVTFLPKYVSQMEIIGNICDNPELINHSTN